MCGKAEVPLSKTAGDSHLFRQEILQFYCQIKKKEKDMEKVALGDVNASLPGPLFIVPLFHCLNKIILGCRFHGRARLACHYHFFVISSISA